MRSLLARRLFPPASRVSGFANGEESNAPPRPLYLHSHRERPSRSGGGLGVSLRRYRRVCGYLAFAFTPRTHPEHGTTPKGGRACAPTRLRRHLFLCRSL